MMDTKLMPHSPFAYPSGPISLPITSSLPNTFARVGQLFWLA